MPAAQMMMSWMQALSDLTRARALRVLERTELTVAELCAVLQSPQSTVSRHLKVLADDGWVVSRREGTSRLYRIATDELDSAAKRLWSLVREQTSLNATADQDDGRLEQVLAERRTRSQAFFSSAAGQWDKLRGELFGDRFDAWALAALADSTAIVGDLGCGTGQMSERLAPFVRHVIAVDNSAPMIKAARARLGGHDNVDLRRGELTALPIDDAALDLATVVLVLHHLPEPAAVLADVARTLKPGGKLLLVDMQRHDRRDYQQDMGHVWLGFECEQITDWLDTARFGDARWVPLPPEPGAKGPSLFTVTAIKH